MENRIQYKFFVLFVVPFLMILFSGGTTILWFVAFFPTVVKTILDWTWFVATIMFLVLPWGLTLYTITLFWPIVTISDKGISQTLLGFWRKKEILWSELYEIRLEKETHLANKVAFSTKTYEERLLDKTNQEEGVIKVSFSRRLLKTIRQFTDQEIIGLFEEDKKADK